MYYPNLFNDSFVQDLFDEMFGTPYKSEKAKAALPRIGNTLTDIQEFGDRFELDMDLPGYDKKDIHVELKDGYLTVRADHAEEKEVKEAPKEDAAETEAEVKANEKAETVLLRLLRQIRRKLEDTSVENVTMVRSSEASM